ncbi:MAG: hypothetical protein GXO60_02580 [Epsilonproteobacteria bacterium]|nr:hypothetical protein [Campylobacterota bacterium]
MKNSINALLIIDIGIVVFCLLSGNRIWFINSQIGFITSSLVILASILSYRNMVKSRLDNGIVVAEDNRDTIEKIEDPFDLYSEDEIEENKSMKEIVQEEKTKLKKNRRSIWQITKDSKAALSFYRLGAYGLLILGFFYLNNNHKLDISSYLFALSIPPIVVIITLMRKK